MNIDPFIQIFGHLSVPIKKRFYLLIPLLAVAGILEVVSLTALIPLIGTFTQQEKYYHVVNSFFPLIDSHDALLTLIVGFTLLVFVLKSVVVFSINKYALTTAAISKSYYQSLLFKKYLSLGFQYHLTRNSSDFIRNLTSECNSLDARFLTPLTVVASELIPITFILIFLILVSPYAVLFSFFAMFLLGMFIIKITGGKLKYYGSVQIENDGYFVRLSQQTFHNLKEIFLYRKVEYLSALAKQYVQSSANSLSKALTLGLLPRSLLEVLAIIIILIFTLISLGSGDDLNETMVALGVFMAALIKLLPSANRFISHIQALNHSYPTVNNLLSELNLTSSQMLFSCSTIDSDLSPVLSFDNITMSDVNFSYNSHSTTLTNVNVTINKGDIVGIYGPSGSGKSTLVNLILGLLSPSSGNILLNGFQISEVRESLSNIVSYVPQDTYIIDDTLARNIIYLESDDMIQFDRVTECLLLAGLGDLLKSLDNGLNTMLGEHGSRLSGGQRQRVGIARALYRDPELIILDEATSSLDSKSEDSIIELVGSLKGSKTIVMISHKLSTLKHCNRMYNVVNGSVIEC